MAEPRTHHYRVTCSWTGSTGVGYDHYDRRHVVTAPPAVDPVRLSSDPAFLGDDSLLSPEQLVVLAASSCQLLAFLAVAARARMDVVAYEDDGEAVMPESDPPTRITEIHLHPRITLRGPVAEDRVRHLVDVAHRQCYIANSLRTDIRITPELTVVRD